jgi:hypothetical protein
MSRLAARSKRGSLDFQPAFCLPDSIAFTNHFCPSLVQDTKFDDPGRFASRLEEFLLASTLKHLRAPSTCRMASHVCEKSLAPF